MALNRRLEKEPIKFLSLLKKVKQFTNVGLWSRSSEFLKHASTKGRRVFLISLAMLMATMSACRLNDNSIKKQIAALQDSVLNNKISVVEAGKRMNDILRKADKEIEMDIKEKNFTEALAKIGVYLSLAKQFDDKDLYAKLLDLHKDIKASMVSHIDLSKPGYYTDKGRNVVYVIGRTNTDQNSAKYAALQGLIAYAGKYGVQVGALAGSEERMLIMDRPDYDKPTVFLLEITALDCAFPHGAGAKQVPVLHAIATALAEKGQFLPMK